MLRRPEAHVIHAALYRPVLIAGVERGLVIVEATLVTALVVMGGFDWRTLSVAAILTLALHPSMAWASRTDAAIAQVYVRSLGAQDFYPPVGSLGARPAPIQPALPRLRG